MPIYQPSSPVYGRDYRRYDWINALGKGFDLYGDYRTIKMNEARAKRDEEYRKRQEERADQRLLMEEKRLEAYIKSLNEQASRRSGGGGSVSGNPTPEQINQVDRILNSNARLPIEPKGPFYPGEPIGRQPKKILAKNVSSSAPYTTTSASTRITDPLTEGQTFLQTANIASNFQNPAYIDRIIKVGKARNEAQKLINYKQDQIHQASKEGHYEKVRPLELEIKQIELDAKRLEQEQNDAVEAYERQARLDKAASAALDRRTKEDKERARKDLAEKQKSEREDLDILFGQTGVPSEYQAREEFGENPDQNLYVADPTMRAFQDAYKSRIAAGTEFTDEQAEDLKKRKEATIKDTFRPGWNKALSKEGQKYFFDSDDTLAKQFEDQFISNEEVTKREAKAMQRMALRAAQAIWNDPEIDLPPGYTPKQVYDDILHERELYSEDHGEKYGRGGDWGPIEGGANAIVQSWKKMNSTDRVVVDDAVESISVSPNLSITREQIWAEILRKNPKNRDDTPYTDEQKQLLLEQRIRELLQKGIPMSTILGTNQ